MDWRYRDTASRPLAATLTILLFTQTLTFPRAQLRVVTRPTVRSSSRPLTKHLNDISRVISQYQEEAPTKTTFSEGFVDKNSSFRCRDHREIRCHLYHSHYPLFPTVFVAICLSLDLCLNFYSAMCPIRQISSCSYYSFS